MLDVQTIQNAKELQSQNGKTALRLAREGNVIFPCHPVTKCPLVKWRTAATADMDQVRSWWRKWPDAMIGLPTGEANGVSVVDLDVRDGKDGIAAARALGIDPDAAGLIVRTAGGGLHLYYDHASGVANSTSESGLDVRGEGGYVIAPGSIGKAGAYSVQKGSLTVARLLGLSAFPAVLTRPERPKEAPAKPGTYDVAVLRTALPYIPNDGSHDEWLHILMALHSATGGSDQGLALAHWWSADDYPGYQHEQVTAKWRSFGKSDGLLITGATILAEARKHGWQADPIEFDDLPDDPAEDDPDLADLLDLSPEASEVAGLPFLTAGQCANLPARDYVVKRLIAPGQVGCIFGEPGAGKSLIAPRLAYAIAQGKEAFGLRTKRAPVFYVACEDQEGMAHRVAALHHDLGAAPGFHLFQTVSDLFSPGQIEGKGSPDLEALRRAVKAVKPGLIVIDTLAMAMPGLEENDAAGMNRVVQIGKALARHGAAVIFVHHGTKAEGNTPRGHSVFNGALDFSIMVKPADQGGIVRGVIRKNRNGPADLDIAFSIGTRRVGHDVDGEPLDAPICEPCEPGAAEAPPRLTRTEQAAYGLALRPPGRGADPN